jgi:phytoene synthase
MAERESGKAGAPPDTAMESAYRHAMNALRDSDRDRYLATLLMPANVRPHVAALYEFDAEIARIRDLVKEPLAGEIRLQWWRDVLSSPPVRPAAGNPVAEALLDTIDRFGLPRDSFQRYLDARIGDLYDDLFPDRTAFEAYAGETSSTVLQLSALVIAPSAAPKVVEAAGHGGVAVTIADTLRSMPRDIRRGKVRVPADILSACGLDRDSLLTDADARKLGALQMALVAYGSEHLEKARAVAAARQGFVFPAFLPLALAAQTLEAYRKAPVADPRRERREIAQWRRQWRLWRSARRLRF